MEVLARLCAARVAEANDSGSDDAVSTFGAGCSAAVEVPPAVMSCSSVGGAADGVGEPTRWSPAGLHG